MLCEKAGEDPIGAKFRLAAAGRENKMKIKI